MRRPRIPDRVALPFGFEAAVVREDSEAEWGWWDDETQTIHLNSKLTPPQARYIFLHEMDHAFKDWQRWVRKTVGVENPDGTPEEIDGDREDVGDHGA